MSANKAPSAVRGDSGLLSTGRFSRTYCKHCQSDELHQNGQCVQCKQGGIPTAKVKMTFNGKVRGMV